MRKLILLGLLFISVESFGQLPWTIINGKQRFAKGLGIPTIDTAMALYVGDSSQIVLNPSDSVIYYRYKGYWKPIGSGGSGTIPNLQQVTDSGSLTTNTIDVYESTNSPWYLGKFSEINSNYVDVNYQTFDGTHYTNRTSFLDKDHIGTGYIDFIPFDTTELMFIEKYRIVYSNGEASTGATQSTNLGFINPTKAANNINFPDSSGTVVLSVNGNFADDKGNITLPTADTVTANNGLNTNTTNNVQLGGTLNKNTVINGSSYNLNLEWLDSHSDSYGLARKAHKIVVGSYDGGGIAQGEFNSFDSTITFDAKKIELIQTNTSSDTSTYKPLGVSSLGVVSKMNNWVLGGGGTVTSISQGYGITNSTNPITTTGTIKVDTTSSGLSGKYLRLIDTATLSTRIDARVKYTDTAAMLSPYLRKIDTTNKWVSSVTKLNDSTIRVIKSIDTTDITLTPASTVTSATRLVTTAYNNSGATIAKGSVVYISGRHSSNYPTIAKSIANSEDNSYKTFAIVETDIANNSTGVVIQAGNISNLNLPTSTYTDGEIVYLSPTVLGGITNVKPLAPNHICKLGAVTRAHPTLGSIEIKIENGWQLEELSDVKIAAVPVDSTVLQFSRVDSLWHDVSVTTAVGNRYIKPSDTATMLSNYAKTNLVNTKLNISDTSVFLRKTDSTTYYTKYRSDTSRTNIYNSITPKFTTPTGWTDYFSSSTIVGFVGGTVTGSINYITMGKLLFVQYYISGTSNSTVMSFTIPYSTVNLPQFSFGRGISNTSTQGNVGQYNAGSSNLITLLFNTSNITVSTWTASGTKYAQGFMILNIN